ncbi:MAG: hypothetical protein HRT95_20990, partial [Moritella sp.]|uniref:PHD finger domain-containing protein n=1 Tax=Moritella sp. TaxID=78556 RepID=UPI001D5F4CE7
MIGENSSREKCGGCNKNILAHNPISICNKCSKLTHAKCSQKYLSFDNLTDSWICNDCLVNKTSRYNPFQSHLVQNNENFGAPDSSNEFRELSEILESCKLLNPTQFNEVYPKKPMSGASNFSILFNNIDGNASNFDSLCAEVASIDNKFPIIALAETNIDESHGPLYKMKGYNSVYQSRIGDKKKGSGLALYISETLEYCIEQQFSNCS